MKWPNNAPKKRRNTLFSNLFSKLARSREPLVRLSNCSLRSRNSGQASWLTQSLPALRQLWTQNCLSDLELSHLQLACCPSTPTVTRRRNWSIWGDVKRSRRLLLLLRNNINLSEKELYIKPLSLALSLFWNEAWGGAKESEEITGGVGIWILLLLLGDKIGPSAMELFIESSLHLFHYIKVWRREVSKTKLSFIPPILMHGAPPPHIHNSGNARNKM